MTESEIMNCAAILAAGVMANANTRLVYNAKSSVKLMEEIANEISKRQFEEQRKNEE